MKFISNKYDTPINYYTVIENADKFNSSAFESR